LLPHLYNLPPMKVMLGATPAAAIPAGNVIQGLPVRHVSAIGSSAILGNDNIVLAQLKSLLHNQRKRHAVRYSTAGINRAVLNTFG
jgi:hypothetical protein